MNADDRDLIDFGIVDIGEWLQDGSISGECFDHNVLADDLPRWLLKEPVILLNPAPYYCVYLRGLYSAKLTKQRKSAVLTP